MPTPPSYAPQPPSYVPQPGPPQFAQRYSPYDSNPMMLQFMQEQFQQQQMQDQMMLQMMMNMRRAPPALQPSPQLHYNMSQVNNVQALVQDAPEAAHPQDEQ